MFPTSKQENPFAHNYLSERPDDHQDSHERIDTYEQFFNKEFLSDCVLIDTLTAKNLRCHCVILASRSEIFNSHFLKHAEAISNGNMKNPHKIQLPIPLEIKTQNLQQEIFERCVNYFYTPNVFDFLMRNGLSSNNCFWYYSYFHVLNHQIALSQIEDYIIYEVIQPINVISCLLEALKFKSQRIIIKCLEIIDLNFEGLIKGKENLMRIKELPFDIFRKIISSGELHVNREETVLQITIDYINFREKEPENPEFLKEKINVEVPHQEIPKDEKDNKPKEVVKKPDDPAAKPEEKKAPEDKKQPPKEEKKDPPPKQVEKGPAPGLKVNENEKVPPKKVDGSVLLGDILDLNTLIKDLFKIFRLTPAQKLELLACCRLSYVEHETLLKASTIPSLIEFKAIFIEAISAKLSTYENASHTYTINLIPRESYREIVENQKNMNINQQNRPINDSQVVQKQGKIIETQMPQEQIDRSLNPATGERDYQFNQNTNPNFYKSMQSYVQKNLPRNPAPIQPTIDPENQTQGYIERGPSPELYMQKNIQQNPPQKQIIQDPRAKELMETRNYPESPEKNSHYNQKPNPNLSNVYRTIQTVSKMQPQIQDRNYESSPPSGLNPQENYLRPMPQNNLSNYPAGGGSSVLSKSQEVPMNYNISPENNANSRIMTASPQGFRIEKGSAEQQNQNQRPQPMKNYSQGPMVQPQTNYNSEPPAFESDERTYNQANIKQPSYRYEDITKIKTAQSLSPVEFVYKYDFDDNGVIYYLGSYGKTRKWVNPNDLKIVDVFFSSIGVGVKPEDFIGRDCVNCCTKNEKNAFMALDLGEGRYLFPSCYTVRNRPSRKYVLMNWILEASVNNNEWYIVDKRINFTEDAHFNSLMEREREDLLQKGQTSTWGIDLENVENILNELNRKSKSACKGFRFYRITQLMKNSDGEYNMCLSGFELYGTGFGTRWYF